MSGKNRRSIKKTIYCVQCKKEVKENDDRIECDKCANNFHASCTGLSKQQFAYLVDNESEEYLCKKCKNNGVSVGEELNLIKTKLTKLDQLDHLSEMRDAITFMSNQYEEILRGVAENKKKIDLVQKENKLLKTEIKELKESIKILNDERVKKNCIIRGVKVKENDTAVDTIIKISKDVGIDLNEKDVEDAHIVKDKNTSGNKHTLIVKFQSIKSKSRLMAAKSKLKENEDTKGVFVNDYLSKETLSVFKYAKSLRNVGYASIYTYNGKVFVRKSDMSKPRLVKSVIEVDDMLMETTTNQSRRGFTSGAITNGNDDGNLSSSLLNRTNL